MTYAQITNDINKFNDVQKTEKQVRGKARIMGLSKKLHKLNREFFNEIDTEEKAYWLGFIYADGWISIMDNQKDNRTSYELGIEVSIVDTEHLQKFAKSLEYDTVKISKKKNEPVSVKQPNGSYSKGNKITFSSTMRVYSKQIVLDLASQGVVERKTDSDIFPEVERHLFKHFLRGYFDGDGCITIGKKMNQCHITSANPEILYYIKEKLENSFGIVMGNIYSEHEKKYRLYVSKKDDVLMFLEFMYQDSCVYLDRKYKLYCSIKNNA